MKYPPIQYHDYLEIDKLLSAQKLRSTEYGLQAHDELLFITVHQTYELWFKQILFEVDSVLEVFKRDRIEERDMGMAVARLERVVEIQKLINGQIDVLETMTPLDFLDFRDALFPASGFQSFQWRILETRLGLKTDQRLNYFQGPFYQALKPEQQTQMKAILAEPSLFDVVEKWLERTPFLQTLGYDFWKSYQASVKAMFYEDRSTVERNPRLTTEEQKRDLALIKQSEDTFAALFDPNQYQKLQEQGYFRLSYKAVHAALFIQIYRDQPLLQLPFRMLSTILNIDEKMTEWRYRHVLMTHRMLGKKIGTGGTSGHEYLKNAAEKHKVFTDFFNLTTFFIPRSKIPTLPPELERKMSFQF